MTLEARINASFDGELDADAVHETLALLDPGQIEVPKRKTVNGWSMTGSRRRSAYFRVAG